MSMVCIICQWVMAGIDAFQVCMICQWVVAAVDAFRRDVL
jgi:hypothetical protein